MTIDNPFTGPKLEDLKPTNGNFGSLRLQTADLNLIAAGKNAAPVMALTSEELREELGSQLTWVMRAEQVAKRHPGSQLIVRAESRLSEGIQGLADLKDQAAARVLEQQALAGSLPEGSPSSRRLFNPKI